jgi:hypothetical protein
MSPLPPAPNDLADERGAPRFGAYAGAVRDTSLARLSGRYRRSGLGRLAVEKKWLYVCFASPTTITTAAVVHFGYVAGAFFYVFDRGTRRMLFDRSIKVPSRLVEVADSAAECRAAMRGLRSSFLIEASSLGGRVRVSLPGASFDATLAPQNAPVPLSAICPVPGDRVTMTLKSCCIPAEGEVQIGSSSTRLENAFACLDYSHGFMARRTHWHWASGSGRLADGRVLGLNLVEGHNDGPVSENGLWLDGELMPIEAAHFRFDPDRPTEDWTIETESGSARLRFRPEGCRSESFDFGLFASEYCQPVGSFSGTVRGPSGATIEIAGLPGVTENHLSVW